jgi:uncharacterized DUF497 family protein
MLKFDWNDANRSHIALHGVSVKEAEQVLLGEPIDVEITYDDEDGDRFQQIGETKAGRILLIVTVWRGDLLRVVTAWDAPRAFKEFFLEQRARQSWTKSD